MIKEGLGFILPASQEKTKQLGEREKLALLPATEDHDYNILKD